MDKLLSRINKPVVLWAIAAFQLLVVLGMIIKSAYPLWVGQPMLVRTFGYDPRDMMRGQYVRLAYDFSRIAIDRNMRHDLDSTQKLYFGDKLYVQMRSRGGLYFPVGLFRQPPDTGRYILALLNQDSYQYRPHVDYNDISLKAGVESYFVSPAEARDIENAVQSSPRLRMEQEVYADDSTGRDSVAEAARLAQEAAQMREDSNTVLVELMVTSGGTARIKSLRYRPPPQPDKTRKR